MNAWRPKQEEVGSILRRYDIEKIPTLAVISIAHQLFERNLDRRPLETLPSEIKTFLLIYYAEGQIDNGGIAQFFYNGYGEHAEETIEALRTIGAEKKATALAIAMASFPEGKYPRSIKEYSNILEAKGGDLSFLSRELDDLYIHKSEEIDFLIIEFVKKHFDIFAP